MKAIHNIEAIQEKLAAVVLYPKDTEKWKQFTTYNGSGYRVNKLCCIPKILKNESNSQLFWSCKSGGFGCVVSQRYWKMKAIHNECDFCCCFAWVVLYPKDTEKWKQFTTVPLLLLLIMRLCCIPKILKNESNSQRIVKRKQHHQRCVVSQRYWKMKAIHNDKIEVLFWRGVVLYPKDTEKWKQFTTDNGHHLFGRKLCCIPKILKNESNSQRLRWSFFLRLRCVVSQRYWKMKAIHNAVIDNPSVRIVVLYPKDTEKWKQFTTNVTSAAVSFELCCIPKILKNESNSQRYRYCCC